MQLYQCKNATNKQTNNKYHMTERTHVPRRHLDPVISIFNPYKKSVSTIHKSQTSSTNVPAGREGAVSTLAAPDTSIGRARQTSLKTQTQSSAPSQTGDGI